MLNDSFKLPNSIWPNGLKRDEEGYVTFYPLGTNKVKVPASSSEWPKGNKFVSPFVYQDDKLVGFIDTKAFTVSKNTAIYLPYEHIEAEFSAIEKGQLQIHAPNAITKKASWKNSGKEDIPSEVQYKYKGCKTVDDVKTVDANYQTADIAGGTWSEPLWDLEEALGDTDYSAMFYQCTNLTSFSSDLLSLWSGKWLFYRCTNLTTFKSTLPNLTYGNSMFQSCSKLTSFNIELPKLETGSNMFDGCMNLTSFTSDLSKLTNSYNMFNYCEKLTSFSSNLSSLKRGNYMFNGCSELTSFNSDLSSLTVGDYMFYNCKLDTASVQNIADTINDVSGLEANAEVTKKIHIGIGNSTPNEQEEVAFNTIVSKGWTVYVNGEASSNKWNPTSLTPLDGEEQQTEIEN